MKKTLSEGLHNLIELYKHPYRTYHRPLKNLGPQREPGLCSPPLGAEASTLQVQQIKISSAFKGVNVEQPFCNVKLVMIVMLPEALPDIQPASPDDGALRSRSPRRTLLP